MEDGTISGYVLDVGPTFFLLAFVDENIRFNGFYCIRAKDIRRLQAPHPHTAFIKAVLKQRGEQMPRKARLKLTSLGELLSTASNAFPLITIHREKVAPEICHIGKIVDVRRDKVSMLEIDPDAQWNNMPTSYRLREITRIDFGGDYEEALALVGGQPKPLDFGC